MIILDNVNRSLQVVLSGAITTNQLPIVASYLDINEPSFAANAALTATTASNSTTPVTVVAPPAANIARQLKFLSVQNADTVAATVIVSYDDNATLRTLVKVTLQPNETLTYDAENGWESLTAAGAAKVSTAAAGSTSTTSPVSPTAPNSTGAYQMQGLAGAITPRTTGNIIVTIAGTFVASAALVNQGVAVQASYGTGAAPTVNTALAGTQIGAIQEWTNLVAATAAGDIHVPFSLIGLISNATLGTALWLDVAAMAITTASVFSLSGVVITAVEV